MKRVADGEALVENAEVPGVGHRIGSDPGRTLLFGKTAKASFRQGISCRREKAAGCDLTGGCWCVMGEDVPLFSPIAGSNNKFAPFI